MKRPHDPRYNEFRSSVLKRDKYRCQLCHSKKRKLNVHHIKKWATNKNLRADSDNGITLCWECHRDIRGKERVYAEFFTRIVWENKRESNN